MHDSYTPIACSLHDEYEIAIMQRKLLNIQWLDEMAVAHTGEVLPENILVKDKQEFLVAKTRDNKNLTIRLDRITFL